MLYRTLIFGLLFVLPPGLKPWVLRTFLGAQVGRGVRIGWLATLSGRRIALGDYCEVRALTLLRCGGELRIGAYSIISSFNLVYGAAGLRVGAHSYVGPQCLINCDEDVQIGRYSALGARCMVYTHGSFLPYTEGYWVNFGSVVLGDYVWCAAGVFLHPGTRIGSNVFVNSRSTVSGEVASGSVLEGNPAQVVGSVDRLKRVVSPRRRDTLAAQMLGHFAELYLRGECNLPVEDVAGGFRVRLGGCDRAVLLVSSAGEAPALPGRHLVLLVTRPHYRPPPGLPAIDLVAGTRPAKGDPLADALVEFLQRYYGIQLEFR